MTTFPLFPLFPPFILQDTLAAHAEGGVEGAERGCPSHLNAGRLSCTSRFWQTRRRKQVQQAWRLGDLDTRAK